MNKGKRERAAKARGGVTRSFEGSFENEALENEDRSTKHPKLENSKTKTPKSRKRKLETTVGLISATLRLK